MKKIDKLPILAQCQLMHQQMMHSRCYLEAANEMWTNHLSAASDLFKAEEKEWLRAVFDEVMLIRSILNQMEQNT